MLFYSFQFQNQNSEYFWFNNGHLFENWTESVIFIHLQILGQILKTAVPCFSFI